MNRDDEILNLKEVIRQQSVVLTSISLILFKIVFNSDGINFSNLMKSNEMGELLKEAKRLGQKTRSILNEDDNERI